VTGGITKRSVMIAGHRTSVSLEDPFWDALRGIAEARGLSVQALIGEIDAGRDGQNLSSAIRVFVLAAVRDGIR
jgi:predicted DNA-binding ribbon-helix-helix protein